MDAQRWQKIKNLFDRAQKLESGERRRFLEKACAGDEELRREVEKIVASFDDATSFMESPAAAEVASLFEDKKTLPANQTTGDLSDGELVAGTILASRYRIIGLLGKGGMGEVYRAEDIKLSQTVALKFLPDKLEKDNAALQRFVGEVRTARQVAHPNVCRVFDIGETAGRHFLSMEFIEGDDLSSLLRRVGRLTSERAVEISRQLCVGLSAIHSAGILHRDFKPANVIIDSKGRAKITDFGIAGLESEIAKDEMRVGTPAYMSPEQITGKGVSQRSDIYALGLVLYEIFTGKQAFQADSISELIRKHRSETPTNPSDHVKGIDPLIEKVIFQCLEKNPKDRPPSALHVAMALPGGNPLQVALEAGETPSPEMVAAAPKKGSLRAPVAVACLSAVILLFAFIVLFAGKVKHHEWIPLEKSPEVLAERAASIVQKLGYQNTATDVDYGFEQNNGKYYGYPDDAPNRWERLRSGQPALISFWHRASPRYLEPLQYESVSSADPPMDVAGMTRVILDTRGRLLEFQAVQPQVKDNAAAGAVDWAAVFSEAGLNIGNYRQTEAKWMPPVFADTILAWEGSHVDHAEIPVRIEAAAFQGKPVYFQVVAPWDKPARQEQAASTAPVKTAGVILILSFTCIILAGVFLAVRNLRQGRADSRGAFRLSVFIFLVTFASSLLVADHIPDLAGELQVFTKSTGLALISAALTAVMYLALEPIARRRWASLIISWSRLMAGDWRDPLVGRDILIGGVIGLAHTALIYLGFLMADWAGGQPAPNPSLEISYLQGFRHLWAMLFAISASKIFYAFGFLLLLILLVTLLKRQWLAIFALWLLSFVILSLAFGSRDGHWFAFIIVALISAVNVVSIARFGLLTAISNQIFFELSFHNAVTANPSVWYFTNTIYAAAVLLGLAIFGFYTSLAGQPILQAGLLLNEE
jgi:predicted Ser/Thr protein kinase